MFRKVVQKGTATLSDVDGYEVGGKTGTAQIVEKGVYTNKKINTFASIFPASNPKYVLIVLLEDTKLSKIMCINTVTNLVLTRAPHLTQRVGHL